MSGYDGAKRNGGPVLVAGLLLLAACDARPPTSYTHFTT